MVPSGHHRPEVNLAFDFQPAARPAGLLSIDKCDMDFKKKVTGLSEEDKAAIVLYISTKVHKEIQEHEIRAIAWQLIAVLSIAVVIGIFKILQ